MVLQIVGGVVGGADQLHVGAADDLLDGQLLELLVTLLEDLHGVVAVEGFGDAEIPLKLQVDSVKAPRIRGAPAGRKKPAPESRKFSGRIRRREKWLTHFKSLRFEEMNGLPHSLLKLLFFEMLGHIDLEQIHWVPDFPSGEHGVNGS